MHRVMLPGVHAQPLSQVKLQQKSTQHSCLHRGSWTCPQVFLFPQEAWGHGAKGKVQKALFKAMWLPCREFMVSLMREEKKVARMHLQELTSLRAAASNPSGEANGKPLVQRGFGMSFALFTLL